MPLQRSSFPRNFGSCRIVEMSVRRDTDDVPRLDALVSHNAGPPVRISFDRPHPIDVALELFFADKLIIESEEETQREYGAFRVEFWSDEAYSEFWADSFCETAGA